MKKTIFFLTMILCIGMFVTGCNANVDENNESALVTESTSEQNSTAEAVVLDNGKILNVGGFDTEKMEYYYIQQEAKDVQKVEITQFLNSKGQKLSDYVQSFPAKKNSLTAKMALTSAFISSFKTLMPIS